MSLNNDISKLLDKLGYDTMALQDILSALRGPDNCVDALDDLKRLTTARIRAIVAPHYNGDVNYIPLTPADMKSRDKLLIQAPPHFHTHYKWAVGRIKSYYHYDLSKEKEC